jgi:hypothetical protein
MKRYHFVWMLPCNQICTGRNIIASDFIEAITKFVELYPTIKAINISEHDTTI